MIDITPYGMTSSEQLISIGGVYTNVKVTQDSYYQARTNLMGKDIFDSSWVSDANEPPHWVCIDYGIPMIFSKLSVVDAGDVIVQTVKDYSIQTSSDGINFKTVFSGTSPNGQTYVPGRPSALITAEFPSSIGNMIRFYVSSKYYRSGYGWTQLRSMKIYGNFGSIYEALKNQDSLYGYK